ncbi:D-tyrosyl-tRNA(Tyr) deacylase [Desulfosarcina sp. OttesenSCG-928-A07]|nr:D-tyrosyl-tRNA(Tyr) deacylase [Desulfosarcina sp. OttesenSCG-928-G17]MDL2329710.1 D-tyrosyl-tRNA(Tyr) deacylase [Desulfosarcina sp. OttesenSCG-928-A07]
MIAVVQRVSASQVAVAETVVGAIGNGLTVLLGVDREDGAADVAYLAEKIVNLRIFEDDGGKMNRSLVDVKGQMLVISQFTLLGDCRKGRRPSFVQAAEPALANRLYLAFIDQVRSMGIDVETGRFGAMMQVEITNEGPVTLIVSSRF